VIDLRFVREHPDEVRASQRGRGEDPEVVDALLAADERRRQAIAHYDELRSEQKTMGKQVAQAQGGEKAALLERTKALSAQVKEAEAVQKQAEADTQTELLKLDNLLDPAAPLGGEEDFVVLEEVGTLPTFDFEVKDHVALLGAMDALDMERGAKVSGSRFYFLKGVAVLLEQALIQYAIATAVRNGFTPIAPPTLVRPEVMDGTGFLGQAAENVYHLEADDLYLVGTSEVSLAGMHAEEILDAAKLPMRYAGVSACYRREAGTYGKDTGGIFRVHQFNKVEMFAYCSPEEAGHEHAKLLGWERDFLSSLELPFRVIDVASGDLGSSAARKFDCEAWIPSQGRYRELTSTSNCTEFQARRLGIRLRDADGVRSAATLNGTLCATTRTMIAIVENHQQADGSVHVPAVLQPFMGMEVMRPTV